MEGVLGRECSIWQCPDTRECEGHSRWLECSTPGRGQWRWAQSWIVGQRGGHAGPYKSCQAKISSSEDGGKGIEGTSVWTTYVIHTSLVIKGNEGQEAIIPFLDEYSLVLFVSPLSLSVLSSPLFYSPLLSLSPFFPPYPLPLSPSSLCMHWKKRVSHFGGGRQGSLSLKWPSKNLSVFFSPPRLFSNVCLPWLKKICSITYYHQ